VLYADDVPLWSKHKRMYSIYYTVLNNIAADLSIEINTEKTKLWFIDKQNQLKARCAFMIGFWNKLMLVIIRGILDYILSLSPDSWALWTCRKTD
jgi:hypothetical protein